MAKDLNGFSKQTCSMCNRVTWHFAQKGQDPVCTDHSVWPTKRKVKVINQIIGPYNAQQEEQQKRRVPTTPKSNYYHEGVGGLKPYMTIDPDSELGKLLNVDQLPTIGSDSLICSFCQDEVSEVRATRGTAAGRVYIIDKITKIDGKKFWEQKKIYVAGKVIACPNCCLHVKPIINKDGKITNQGVEVLNTD